MYVSVWRRLRTGLDVMQARWFGRDFAAIMLGIIVSGAGNPGYLASQRQICEPRCLQSALALPHPVLPVFAVCHRCLPLMRRLRLRQIVSNAANVITSIVWIQFYCVENIPVGLL